MENHHVNLMFFVYRYIVLLHEGYIKIQFSVSSTQLTYIFVVKEFIKSFLFPAGPNQYNNANQRTALKKRYCNVSKKTVKQCSLSI